MKLLKTLRSYDAHARYLASELHLKPSGLAYIAGHFPRHFAPAREPYRYSPTLTVYRLKDMGALVVILETAHRKYEVWRLADHHARLVTSEAEAEAENARYPLTRQESAQ